MENQTQNLKDLTSELQNRLGKPVSPQVVEAAIESLGIRPKDTPVDYGYPSIEALAAAIYQNLRAHDQEIPLRNFRERESEARETITISDYATVKMKLFSQYYSLGIFHLLPVFIQIAAIILFGYSLWTYTGFNEIQSTAVVLGVIVGMVSTGGFVQVIGKQASFYWNYKDYAMVQQTISYLFKLGMKTLFSVLFGIFLVNFFFHIYPYEVLLIVFCYAFFVGLLLLILAPLHPVKQRWMITVSILAGTVAALLLKNNSDYPIYITHWFGITITILVTQVFLFFFFKNIQKKGLNANSAPLKTPVVLFHNYSHFLYGMLLYAFIFVDRILAWSSGIQANPPFLVYFEKNYELGMDLAILVFLLLAGVLEFSIATFTRFIDIGQRHTASDQIANYALEMQRNYRIHVIALWITGLLAFGLIFYLLQAPWALKNHFKPEMIAQCLTIFIVGGIGYIILAWGILNTLYLFTLGQIIKPLKAIVYAIIINFLVGFILSRFVAYDYSVFGMLVGAIVFMMLTCRALRSFFKQLDYHYYAAF